MTAPIRVGNRVQHVRGGTGVASAPVINEHTGKPHADSIEVTWDATGDTTVEWKADLTKIGSKNTNQ